MTADTSAGTDGIQFSPDGPGHEPRAAGEGQVAGVGPYKLAMRRMRRNKVALAFGVLFLIIVVMCLLAPYYAHHVAHTTPSANHVTDQFKDNGKLRDVVSVTGEPVGPTWHKQYFLGADDNGRDVAVRLLYGGRNSLEVGALATLITMFFGVMLGMVAGFFRGWVDAIVSFLLDVTWAYPAVLLGIALGTALALDGINLGFVRLEGNSLLVPAVIIGAVYVPYVAKPIRGQTLSLREKEFIDAARVQGFGSLRIIVSDVLPNIASTILVFVPLILANAILLEAGLSYLGAGVRPPNPSWGTMISDSLDRLTSSPHLVFAPSIMLVLCVLGINVFGDGVRDALDPRAKVRLEH